MRGEDLTSVNLVQQQRNHISKTVQTLNIISLMEDLVQHCFMGLT